jgi:hypothetical protein
MDFLAVLVWGEATVAFLLVASAVLVLDSGEATNGAFFMALELEAATDDAFWLSLLFPGALLVIFWYSVPFLVGIRMTLSKHQD